MERSVYSPGAGHTPQVLAGRDQLLHDITLWLNDISATGRARAQDVLFTGVRGVGKTAMLTAYSATAAGQGFEVVSHQAVRGQSGLVEAILARAEQRIEQGSSAWRRAKRALDRVAGVSVGVAGVSVGVNLHDPAPTHRVVYPEVLAEALATLAAEIRRDTPTGGVLVMIDEMQVASVTDLPLLAATLHRLNVDHPAAAVAFAGTGLPHLLSVLNDAGVTHANRLFRLEELPPTLSETDALYGIIEPARRAGITWEPDAARLVVQLTNGYPAHLQLFADEAWKAAPGPHTIDMPSTLDGARQARDRLVTQALRPRLNDLTARQLEFLAALAVCGGHATTRSIAHILGRPPSDLSWIRDQLLREGDIYTPHRGQLVMAVPVFVSFLLANYEQARAMTDTDLLPLDEMTRRQRSEAPQPGQAPAITAAGLTFDSPPPGANRLPAPQTAPPSTSGDNATDTPDPGQR